MPTAQVSRVEMIDHPRNRQKFLRWSRRFAPDIFVRDTTGLADATAVAPVSGTPSNAVIDGLKVLADTYIRDQDRRDLFNTNAERAKLGLGPLDAQGNPVAGLTLLSPGVVQALQIGAVGLAVYWITGAMSPRRR